MFELALRRYRLPSSSVTRPYPEQDSIEEGSVESALLNLYGWATGYRAWLQRELGQFPARVQRAAAEVETTDLSVSAQRLRGALRRHGLTPELIDRAFALIRALAGTTLGMRHFDVQLKGGYALLKGVIAEMETGEGKSLTGKLASGTMALAGVPVHVVTVNDYLARRDAEFFQPLYQALGLTVGVIQQGMSPQQRRAAYACDITYCSNKELVFDYLKDRTKEVGRKGPMHRCLSNMAAGTADAGNLLLRGLHFAIVDEADSVLIDEARTPLILSAASAADSGSALYETALTVARELVADDWQLIEQQRQVQLLPAGQAHLSQRVEGMDGLWTSKRWREEIVIKALTALHCYRKDEHYIVADGKVQIVDEYTGRVMPDRAWEQGLHQLIECKEGCEITGQRHTIARITYQRFFRRYLRVGGMTGTAQEVKRELWEVYRLPVVRIPTHRPTQRKPLGTTLSQSSEARWQQVADEVQRTHHHEGRPVLIGTRSVAASEHLSQLLHQRGLTHVVLNARDEAVEADIIARAGTRGQITVSTNMAGRGTDIKLGSGVEQAGGLKVMLTEFHESARIDRQLFGRCARQGEAGGYVCFAALDDELFTKHGARAARWVALRLATGQPLHPRLARWLIRWCQFWAEGDNRRVRMQTLEQDRRLDKVLGFSPHAE